MNLRDDLERRCADTVGINRSLSAAGIAMHPIGWRSTGLMLLRAPRLEAPPVLLLHGATYSAASVFDLEVPGHPRNSYSTLLQMHKRGLDCWALDFAGYGLSRTPLDGREEGPDDYVEQTVQATRAIRAQTGRAPVLVGWSWGGQVASRAVGAHPEEFAALVFWGGFWGGSGLLETVRRRPVPQDHRRVNTPAHAAADFATPGHFRPEVKRAFVRQALRVDPTSPTTGVIHSTRHMPLHDPHHILRPTLVIHGSHDPIVDAGDIGDYVAGLRNCKASHQRIERADHNVQYSEARHLLFDQLARFTQSIPHQSHEETVP